MSESNNQLALVSKSASPASSPKAGSGEGVKKREKIRKFVHVHSPFHRNKEDSPSRSLSSHDRIFGKVNDMFHKMGIEGLTTSEMEMLVNKYGPVLSITAAPEKPVTPQEMSKEDLLQLYNSQASELQGLKEAYNVNQKMQEDLLARVEELNQQLTQERKESHTLLDKTNALECEVARLESAGHQSEDTARETITKLEETMRQRVEQLQEKLQAEQARVQELEQQVISEQTYQRDLAGRLGASSETIHQELNENMRTLGDNLEAQKPAVIPDAPPMIFDETNGAGKTPTSRRKLKRILARSQSTRVLNLLGEIVQAQSSLKKTGPAPPPPVNESQLAKAVGMYIVDRRRLLGLDDDQDVEEDEWSD